ncbi:hypothetical protein DSO57_1035268 [Entomophthora muscae]|uniref:Uncharacterized protein n=1 Tax=Entomophthora muscae TaxID=34485 RepID=A0ACC2TAL1_9FUNG|nr:hypothetical protein DSO57_1035268 [Entomophthora muscae]
MIYIYIVLFYLVNGLPQNLFEGFANALNPETNGLARAALAPLNFLPSSSSGSPPGVDLKQFDGTLNGNIIDPSLETLSNFDMPANATAIKPEVNVNNLPSEHTDDNGINLSVEQMNENIGNLLGATTHIFDNNNEDNPIELTSKLIGENLNDLGDIVDMATNFFGNKSPKETPQPNFPAADLPDGVPAGFDFKDFFDGLSNMEQAKLQQSALNTNELSSPTSHTLANPNTNSLKEVDPSMQATPGKDASSNLSLNMKPTIGKMTKPKLSEQLSKNNLETVSPTDELTGEQSNTDTPAEEPVAEQSNTETTAEEPSAEQSNTEAPAEEPTTEQSNIETPTEEPSTEQSNTEAPAEEPTTEQSNIETPTEEPSTEQSNTEAPAEEPTTEQSNIETPTEEPSTEQSNTEAPAEEPTTEESNIETPTEEPVTEKSNMEIPIEEPTTEQSNMETSTEELADEQANKEPLIEGPASEKDNSETPAEALANKPSNAEASEDILSEVVNDGDRPINQGKQQGSTKEALDLKEMVENDSKANQDAKSKDPSRKPGSPKAPKVSAKQGIQPGFRGKQKRPSQQRDTSNASRRPLNNATTDPRKKGTKPTTNSHKIPASKAKAPRKSKLTPSPKSAYNSRFSYSSSKSNKRHATKARSNRVQPSAKRANPYYYMA